MARPTWNKLETYPANPKTWSFSRWAWEFLRRNPEFQRRCDLVMNAQSGPRRGMAREFGLAEFKHYKESHAHGENECLWLSEAICKYDAANNDRSKSVEFSLKRGEVALVFDLMQIKKVGLATIDAQLSAARAVLLEYFEKLGEIAPKKRVSKEGLLNLLRVYDAVDYENIPQVEVAKLFYPEYFKPVAGGYDDRAEYARGKINDQLKRARKMVESDYLYLPSRDYRQNRAKR